MYTHEDFKKFSKILANNGYIYSYNEGAGAHQFTSADGGECLEFRDYSTAEGKPEDWDGVVCSDWHRICLDIVEELGFIDGIE